MDYNFFVNKTSSILLDNGFYKGPEYNGEQWYLKIMPPVLYAIHITDSNNYTQDSKYISYINSLYEKLKDCRCENLVCLNINFSIDITSKTKKSCLLYTSLTFLLKRVTLLKKFLKKPEMRITVKAQKERAKQ